MSGHSLKLDPATSSYVKDIRDLANRGGITAKSDVLFFYNSPGSVFAIGAHSPGVPWFFSISLLQPLSFWRVFSGKGCNMPIS